MEISVNTMGLNNRTKGSSKLPFVLKYLIYGFGTSIVTPDSMIS